MKQKQKQQNNANQKLQKGTVFTLYERVWTLQSEHIDNKLASFLVGKRGFLCHKSDAITMSDKLRQSAASFISPVTAVAPYRGFQL